MQRRRYFSFLSFFCFLLSFSQVTNAQKASSLNLVYVDKEGVMRYTGNHKEASFFGVNYTVPFAYGYRSVKALGINHEKAIEADVYHLARLGLDAFRVHVWDTEITDSLGNLKENEHLRLFDYLIAKLKERNIKIFLTPLAFWGPGYPEPDIKTGSFSSIWNKQQVLVTEAAIKAQENYLTQLLRHVNPYTGQTYGSDPDVIALEVNNEPHHSGTLQQAAGYIARMVTAVKSSGWTKPIFYNISESPRYASAVANAAIDGVSFQWYPTGLVANRSLKGNFLPNVDVYTIPFDTIPSYKNKARMVYEFDAGDVLESYMYGAMARSFRSAGFQWATQFAYDPMATAYGNTEYQTHYLNLAYTPSKAISLLIAAKIFHAVPRGKKYAAYPADTAFEAFRVSYKELLSEMNTADEFYYSNTTSTQPTNVTALKHIAGVGSSPVVSYEGTGAYFFDKIKEGVWRLEVMPDAVYIQDPFEKASPKKEVTRIQWQGHRMQVRLPHLGRGFTVKGVNGGNTYATTTSTNEFLVYPGTYLIQGTGKGPGNMNKLPQHLGTIRLNEFVAPQPSGNGPFVVHQPSASVPSGKPLFIRAKLGGIDSSYKASVEVRNTANKWKTVPLLKSTGYDYAAEVPADMMAPGLITYRILIQKDTAFTVFPGNEKGNPYAWDAYKYEAWQSFAAPEKAKLELFNATRDRGKINIYNPDWQNNTLVYTTTEEGNQLAVKATLGKPAAGQVMGWHAYIRDELEGRLQEAAGFKQVVLKGRGESGHPVTVRVALITWQAQAFVKTIALPNSSGEVVIPLSEFRPDSFLLLPRPYPHFLPLWFKSSSTAPLNLADVERLEISFGHHTGPLSLDKSLSVEIASVWLQQ